MRAAVLPSPASLIPFVKFVALLSICFSSSSAWRRRLFVLIRDGSKWSMADVFVTAVFVAFLSAHTAANTMDAKVENGEEGDAWRR